MMMIPNEAFFVHVEAPALYILRSTYIERDELTVAELATEFVKGGGPWV
jgi:hypothetical protein